MILDAGMLVPEIIDQEVVLHLRELTRQESTLLRAGQTSTEPARGRRREPDALAEPLSWCVERIGCLRPRRRTEAIR